LILYGAAGADGAVERIGLGFTNLWVANRRGRRPVRDARPGGPKLSAARGAGRPRDFFGQRGGRVKAIALGVPAFLWRPFAPRSEVSPRDDVALRRKSRSVRDRATLSNGRGSRERLR